MHTRTVAIGSQSQLELLGTNSVQIKNENKECCFYYLHISFSINHQTRCLFSELQPTGRELT